MRIDHEPKTMSHCCSRMKEAVETVCDQHADPFDCPDVLLYYTPKFDEYGIIVHDGGSSFLGIDYCPWCGSKLPESKRNRWFEELQRLGFREPFAAEIPDIYRDARWYSQ